MQMGGLMSAESLVWFMAEHWPSSQMQCEGCGFRTWTSCQSMMFSLFQSWFTAFWIFLSTDVARPITSHRNIFAKYCFLDILQNTESTNLTSRLLLCTNSLKELCIFAWGAIGLLGLHTNRVIYLHLICTEWAFKKQTKLQHKDMLWK